MSEELEKLKTKIGVLYWVQHDKDSEEEFSKIIEYKGILLFKSMNGAISKCNSVHSYEEIGSIEDDDDFVRTKVYVNKLESNN